MTLAHILKQIISTVQYFTLICYQLKAIQIRNNLQKYFVEITSIILSIIQDFIPPDNSEINYSISPLSTYLYSILSQNQ